MEKIAAIVFLCKRTWRRAKARPLFRKPGKEKDQSRNLKLLREEGGGMEGNTILNEIKVVCTFHLAIKNSRMR